MRRNVILSLLTTLWMLTALPLAAQIGGFAGADDDRDGLPDDFEQAVLEKFRPTWRISPADCNGLPAEFLPGVPIPTVKEQNGAIYGQVFIRGSSTLGFFIEAHFYDLWAADCGYINNHQLDAEHVAVLIRAKDPYLPLAEWHASQWYAAAHEDTICDSSQFASAAIVDSEDKGPTFWIARGKHGAFFSEQVCRVGGCGLDRCEASTLTLTSSPINLGEPNVPLNGAVWASSNQWPLLAKMRSDFPTFSTFSSLSYSLPDRGGESFSTTGTPFSPITGYASIQNTSASARPAGVLIFGVRRNNVLVTEAAVPASAPVLAGRIYAEVRSPVKTGLAIANPNNQPAQISFFFTDSNGRNFGHNTIGIPAKGLIGRFLNEPPFNSGSLAGGTFTFTSSAPVSVVALRSHENLRNELLITTLPVAPLSATPDPLVVFPHFADGGGWTTQLVLVNSTEDIVAGRLEFFGQGTTTSAADPVEVTLNGQTASAFGYTIPPRSAWLGRSSGLSASTHIGSVRVTPAASSAIPSGVAIFSFSRGGIVVTESGVPAMPAGSAFRLFAESSGSVSTAEPGSFQTAIAISNLAETPAAVRLELTTFSGAPIGVPGNLTVPGRGQVAMFLNQLPEFFSLPSTFQGMLRISTSSSGAISVIGLRGRYNERRDFLIATIPVAPENITDSGAEALFPYFAEGGGYTTQFILSSPSDGEASSGWLRFYSQSGVPLNLSLK